MSEAFIVRKSVDKLRFATSILLVEYPKGFSCVCKKDGTTLRAYGKHNIWAFSLPSIGTWTITCVDTNGNTITKTITISEHEVLSVNMRNFVPAQYQAVEYIESTTAGLVDTKINLADYALRSDIASNINMTIDCQRTTNVMGNACVWGNFTMTNFTAPTDEKGSGIVGGYRGTELFMRCGESTEPYATSHVSFIYGSFVQSKQTQRHEIGWNMQYYSFQQQQMTYVGWTISVLADDEKVGSSSDAIFTPNIVSDNTIALFAGNLDKSNPITNLRVYGGKLSFESAPIANFLPCYRKSDGRMGFWDGVRGMFLPVDNNSNFQKGEDITIE